MEIKMGSSSLNITPSRLKEWREAYPQVNIEKEIERMNSWWLKHPTRTKWKTLRGAVNWLEKAQQNAPVNRLAATTSYEESTHPAIMAEKAYVGEGEAKYKPIEEVRELLGNLMRTL